MSRRKYVYARHENGDLIRNEAGELILLEAGADYRSAEARAQTTTEGVVYGQLQATDGTDLSTRKKHREYMKAKGVTTADDFKETWAKQAEDRAKFYRGDFDHKARREQLGRAMYQLEKRKRR